MVDLSNHSLLASQFQAGVDVIVELIVMIEYMNYNIKFLTETIWYQ